MSYRLYKRRLFHNKEKLTTWYLIVFIEGMRKKVENLHEHRKYERIHDTVYQCNIFEGIYSPIKCHNESNAFERTNKK